MRGSIIGLRQRRKRVGLMFEFQTLRRKFIEIFDRFYPYLFFGYLILIVLVPKLPIFNFYTVPVRIEDLILVPILLILAIRIFLNRKIIKVSLIPLLKDIYFWILFLLVSTLVGIFLLHTSGPIGLAFVLRFVEYTSFFLIAVWGLRKVTQVKFLINLFIAISIPVSLYSIAQKIGFLGGFGGGFYQYSYVPGTDRSFATFSGPYELGAFYILLLPILAGQIVRGEGKTKALLIGIFLLSLLGLAFTGARTPIFASAAAVLVMWAWSKKRLLLPLAVVSLVIPIIVSSTLSQRLSGIAAPIFNLVEPTLAALQINQSPVVEKIVEVSDGISKLVNLDQLLIAAFNKNAGTPESNKPNLLINSDFNNGIAGWSAFGKYRLAKLQNEFSSTGIAFVLEPSPKFGGLSQTIQGLNPNKVYQASADFYVSEDFDFSGTIGPEWYGVVYWHGYRGSSPLLYNRDLHLDVTRASPKRQWFKSTMNIAGVDELLAVPPVGSVKKGKIVAYNISLRELGDFTGPLEPTTSSFTAESQPINTETSLSWRLEETWPRMFDMLKLNVLTGGGMSSVGIGLDSEYATLLGETGIIGLAIFLWLMYQIIKVLRKGLREELSEESKWVLLSVLAITVGLLIEATFVDVFRASKIASLYWVFVGASVMLITSKKRGGLVREKTSSNNSYS